MLIEFVGFSSSGKSSLIAKLKENYYQETMNIVELDYGNQSYSPTWESLLFLLKVDLKVIFRELGGDAKKLIPLFKNIINQKTSISRKIALIRSLTRKFYLSKLYANQLFSELYLFDEGLLQACINIAVTSNEFDPELLSYTRALIESNPPDLVVYLKPPLEQIVQRASNRYDRKQWRNTSLKTMSYSIALFDSMVRELYNHQLLVINGSDVEQIICELTKIQLSEEKKNARS